MGTRRIRTPRDNFRMRRSTLMGEADYRNGARERIGEAYILLRAESFGAACTWLEEVWKARCGQFCGRWTPKSAEGGGHLIPGTTSDNC